MRVKKIYYIFILLICLQINAFSQKKDFVNEHLLGIKLGGNMYNINDEYLLSSNDAPWEYGMNIGISFKSFLEKSAGTYLGLNYVQKGGYSVFIYDNDEIQQDTIIPVLFYHSLEYFELPFLMNIRIGSKHSRINFYLGPGISYLYKQHIDTLTLSYGNTFKTGTDLKFEFAVNVGGGYSFNYKKGELELSLMYTHGLSNIFEAQTINKSLFNQTQALTVSLHYYYKIKGNKEYYVKD